ncbi:hypothetical protein C6361_15295 [Plantactinospora sp. BC1]|uniref:hypothetical protein n=1 Tax=Plantactinospora sp. BC1 TaxID=2108470 RepID=UPI000D1791BC|nr:hypothetical protein [Plantactinospora sp. BC1]AVT30617.1 hypothetical protein C6361_15295 [Plantactinospora sp. BC1]
MARLAQVLRDVHADAGEPPLERMRLGPSSSAANLSRAKNGLVLPTRECLEAFLRGCGITGGDTYDSVLRLWAETAVAAEAFRSGPASCETDDALVDALVALAARQGLVVHGRLDTAELARRLAEAAGSVLGQDKQGRSKWTVRAVPESEIVAEFVDRSRPPTELVLDHVVFACGGLDGDVRYWRKHLHRIQALRRQEDVLDEIGSARRASLPPARLTPGATPPVVPGPRSPEPVPRWPETPPAEPSQAPPAQVPPSPRPVLPVPARWLGVTWTRRSVLTAAVAGATGMALAGTAGVLVADRGDPEPVATPTAPSSPPVGSAGPVLPDAPAAASTWLYHLADLVRQGTEAPATGRYAYTRARLWSRETTPAGRDGGVTVEEEQLWWAEDLSGLRVVTRTDRNDQVPTSHPFPPGGLTIVVRSPSADPAILVGQLDREQPPHLGPVGRLRAVASVNMFHPLDRQQRAAVLTVLAGTAGLTYRGVVQDRLRRGGIAVSADVAGSAPFGERVTLIFSTATGELLSQETSRLPGPGGADPADGATSGYTLYLERSRTDRLG